MSTATKQVCLEALSLPRDARAQIAHRLLVSLEQEDFAEDVSAAWQAEIQHRRADFRAGAANSVPVEEALRRTVGALTARD